jgi:hypothetical protein
VRPRHCSPTSGEKKSGWDWLLPPWAAEQVDQGVAVSCGEVEIGQPEHTTTRATRAVAWFTESKSQSDMIRRMWTNAYWNRTSYSL